MSRVAAVVALAVAAMWGGPAAPADASRIVYSCRYDLCAISPDGGARHRLTHVPARRLDLSYSDPSVSRDGRRLAFVRGYWPRHVEVADRNARHRRTITSRFYFMEDMPLLRPDGRALLWKEGDDASSMAWSRQRLPPRTRPQSLGLLNYDVAWGPHREVLFAELNTICVLGEPGTCDRVVARAPATIQYLSNPALAPDGRRLVVMETGGAPGHTDDRRLALYDLRTHRRLRTLTSGPNDQRPVWSPDGRWVAFWRVARNQSPADWPRTHLVIASILRVRATGGRPRTVVARRVGVGPPAWSE